jgi:hypothetical protein
MVLFCKRSSPVRLLSTILPLEMDRDTQVISVRTTTWKTKGWCVVVVYADSVRLVFRAQSRDQAREQANQIRTDPAFAAALRSPTQDAIPVIAKLQADGVTSLRAIANELNERNIPTPRGFGKWYASQVARALHRT